MSIPCTRFLPEWEQVYQGGWIYQGSGHTRGGVGIPGLYWGWVYQEYPPWYTYPPVLTSNDGHRSVRYAIYWNAFLLSLWQLHPIIEISQNCNW